MLLMNNERAAIFAFQMMGMAMQMCNRTPAIPCCPPPRPNRQILAEP
jgi:hypothetical protein